LDASGRRAKVLQPTDHLEEHALPSPDSAEFASLRLLFVDQLRCLHDLESKRLAMLQRLGTLAQAPATRERIERRKADGIKQIQRLGNIFSTLGESPDQASMVGAGFHYEIASYATAQMWARHLGLEGIGELLGSCHELDRRQVQRVAFAADEARA
jgi:ferritin-like metal-binding protein YciE